jgi:DNA-binding HxlR family transcriptional regulator
LTAATVNGSGNGARSGAQILTVLAAPLNCAILRSLAAGPRRQVDLRRNAGSPALSTLRSHLRVLEGLGALVKRRCNSFPGSLEYELAGPGEELRLVIATLERWLARAPHGRLELGDEASKGAVKALVEGWSSTMLRVLAAGPHSLTELDRLIGAYNYPSIERRLQAMRLSELVVATERHGSGTPYAVTDWLRSGVGPLVAASRWERLNVPAETARIGRIDAEAALMLAVPLLRLPEKLEGVCLLAVELSTGSEARPATVTARVEEGRACLCAPRNGNRSDAWATGTAGAWFRAARDADPDLLEIGGDGRLAQALLGSLYEALFGSRALLRSQAGSKYFEIGT